MRADKLRMTVLDANVNIKVTFDKDARTITIADSGIGMTVDELRENLGTIAKSGTRQFLENLTGDQVKDSQMIGQFGVGFYSAFIVADKVSVISRRHNTGIEDSACWESRGDSQYTIEAARKPSCGTDVILHLKEGEDEFLDDFRLRGIIKKYSDHIATPIIMLKEKVTDQDDKDDKDSDKLIKQYEEETVNQAKALWVRDKSDIKNDDYIEFYKHISHDFEDPLVWSHNKVEGKLEYTSLLYIPKRAPFDLWNRDVPHGLKLYVQRVFIMDDAKQFLPLYLRFIKGVVDSKDLPLNVSREILQEDKRVNNMRSALTKRALSMLTKLADNDKEKYATVWKEFGNVLKEGVVEDFSQKDTIAGLLRFASTHNDDESQTVSLQDYIGRMQSDQDKIYYVTADTYNAG